MNKLNKARKLFGSVDFSSSTFVDSVIYISSSDDEAIDGWDSDWSTDTEEIIRRVGIQVVSCPIPVGKRRMTTANDEFGPSISSRKKIVPPSLTKGTVMRICAMPPRKARQSA